MRKERKMGIKSKGTLAILIAMIIAVQALAYTSQNEPPRLAKIFPNPLVLWDMSWNVHFFGSNMVAESCYFVLDNGKEKIFLEPESVPGDWCLRSYKGTHFVYWFFYFKEFFLTLGDPPFELAVQAFNVGRNGIMEYTGGDDQPSNILIWSITMLPAYTYTDPTKEPVLSFILPNPLILTDKKRDVHFFGENLVPEDSYWVMDTGKEIIPLDPGYVPGNWGFRCPYGYHFFYTFSNPREFFTSIGSPPFEMAIRVYNVGKNLIPENIAGDDLPSQEIIWKIIDQKVKRELDHQFSNEK